jgi:hypothetical protein
MATSLIEVESLLAIDVGSVNTRAFLFDVADGSYRFLAAGTARTTNGGPLNDIAEGIRLALERLQEITGRTFLGGDRYLIVPSQPDGSGVDSIVTTISSGPALKTVIVGLLADVSVESAQRLVAGTYTQITEVIGLNDRRRMETQIDAIIRLQPDIVVVAGGIEGGASRSVTRMLEMVSLACRLISVEKRPQVVYAGNSALANKAKKILESLVTVRVTTNIRPSFDVEDLNPASETLVDIVKQVRLRQMGNFRKLSLTLEEHVSLSASAFGRMIRFLSQSYEGGKGVLGVDLGANTTTVAAGFGGKLALSVCPNLGIGEGLAGILPNLQINDLTNWLPVQISEDYVRSYLYNKPLYPATVPATLDDLAIEQAMARVILRMALKQSAQRYPVIPFSPPGGLTSQFEPILASGSVLSHSPTPGQAMLLLLDALQPVGVTTLVLDLNNITSSLGAAAAISSLLPVQVLESTAFLNLGSVISPISYARYGTPILNVSMKNPEGEEQHVEVKQGMLTVLPLPNGQKARLRLDPLPQKNMGNNWPGQSLNLNVTGGVLGCVIDARGRPLALPADASRRRDMIKKWLWVLGG